MDFIGIVEVPISRLLFLEESGQRLYDDANRQRLAELFRDTQKDHTNVRHLIDGYIDISETGTVLREAGLSFSEITQQNNDGKYPLIKDASVRYTQGQHRIAAAKAIDPSARWAVNLHQTHMERLSSNPVVRKQTEQYQHEKPFTDGHIYAKLRLYQNEEANYNEWYHRLTKPKKTGMLAIDLRVNISSALNELMNIPAILDGLYLTTFQKLFVLRLDEELLTGIRSLYSQWLRFAGGNLTILKQMDKNSVANLVGRAPRVCHEDRLSISAAFSCKHLFPKVDSPAERHALELRIQQTIGIIPSLLSLQSDLRFLCIAAKIIWEYLMPKSLRLKAKNSKLSLKATLRGCWRPSTPYIEIREGEFAVTREPPDFDLVYIQLILAAIRDFPYLGRWEPKSERGETLHFSYSPHHAALFCRRAKLLGIQTTTIDENMETFVLNEKQTPPIQFRNRFDESEALRRLENRWGRPSASIYWRIRQEGFLPNIMTDEATSRLSAIFVLGSTLACCFNLPSFNIDLAQGVCSLNQQSEQTHHRQLETIMEEDELNGSFQRFPDNRSRSDVSMSDADPWSAARNSSDISMPDANFRSASRSGSDLSMRDTSPSTNERRAHDALMRNANLTAYMAGRTAASIPPENLAQTQATTCDTSYPHGKRYSRYDAKVDQIFDSNRVATSAGNRDRQDGHSSDALQNQQLIDIQARPREESAPILPRLHDVVPSELRRQTTRWGGERRDAPHIRMGESAMTPPGSLCQAENIHARPLPIPDSPSQRSSMVVTPQPYVGRDTLMEQSNWHRGSSFCSSNAYLPMAAMLNQNAPPSPCVPHRLSEIPTASIPSPVSISDLQSTFSQPQFSFIHGTSPSHIMPPPSLQSDTVTRSSYTMPNSLYHGYGDAISAQKPTHHPANWQGFNDSDDEYESIDID